MLTFALVVISIALGWYMGQRVRALEVLELSELLDAMNSHNQHLRDELARRES